jgi:hypothetical protein
MSRRSPPAESDESPAVFGGTGERISARRDDRRSHGVSTRRRKGPDQEPRNPLSRSYVADSAPIRGRLDQRGAGITCRVPATANITRGPLYRRGAPRRTQLCRIDEPGEPLSIRGTNDSHRLPIRTRALLLHPSRAARGFCGRPLVGCGQSHGSFRRRGIHRMHEPRPM